MQNICLKGLFGVFIFFTAIVNHSNASQVVFSDDSLLVTATTTKDLKQKVDCLNRLSFLLLDGGDKIAALKYLAEADSISRTINYPKGLAYGAFYRGILAWNNKDSVSAEKFMINSIDSLELAGETLDLYSPLSAIRIFFNETGQYEKKLRFYQSRLKHYTTKKLNQNIGSCYHGMGNYYNVLGYTEKAIEYYTKAFESWKKSDNIYCYNAMYVVMAQLYIDWGNRNYAVKYLEIFRKANTIYVPFVNYIIYFQLIAQNELDDGNYEKARDNFLQFYAYRNRLSKTNGAIICVNLAHTYIMLNKADSAEFFLQKAEQLMQNSEYTIWNPNGDLEYDFYLAEFYLFKGEKEKAYQQMQKALAKVKHEKYNRVLLKYLNQLAVLSQKMGKHDEAFQYLREHNQLKDSLERASQASRVTLYETERKEQQITLLNKDNLLKQSEIKRQKILTRSFFGGFAIVLVFAAIFFRQRNKIKQGKKRSDELLLNILPSEVAEELKLNGSAAAQLFNDVTVLFTDFKNFTQVSEKLTPQELVNEINYCYCNFDRIITKHGIEKIKTIGDSYMCAGGLPVTNTTHAFDAVNAALEIRDFMIAEKMKREQKGETYFEIRIGLNSGSVVAGIVGIKKFAYDIWGDTVNIASRMESSGEVGKVNVSGDTHKLIKNHFHCEYRGKIEAKNKGAIEMYFVNRSLA